jgi:hypothetical protein
MNEEKEKKQKATQTTAFSAATVAHLQSAAKKFDMEFTETKGINGTPVLMASTPADVKGTAKVLMYKPDSSWTFIIKSQVIRPKNLVVRVLCRQVIRLRKSLLE